MAWLFGWSYRKSHVINPASGAGKNYQIKIKVHYGNGDDSGENVYLGAHSRKDFGDVRFTKNDGITELPYWIQKKVDSDYAIFWVKITDDLSNSDVTIYVYYGNPEGTYPFGDDQAKMDATFLFADHFYGTNLDTNKWTIEVDGNYVSVSDSKLVIQRKTSPVASIRGNVLLGVNTASESYAYCSRSDAGLNIVVNAYRNKDNFDDWIWQTLENTNTRSSSRKNKSASYSYTDGPYDWTEPTRFTIKREETRIRFYVNGSLLRTFTNTNYIPTVNMVSFFRGSNTSGRTLYVDYIFYRKYVDPEPTHGSWGEEEKWSPPWLSGWFYRKAHSINRASNAGKNYQIKIKAHYGSGTDSGENVYMNNHCRTDFGDVRFTERDGTTLLDYWMEEKQDSDYAIFWVKVSEDLSLSEGVIYIYYGNSNATTTSNGDNTFIFFDDFESGNFDKWTSHGDWEIVTSPVKQGTYAAYHASDSGYFLEKDLSIDYSVRVHLWGWTEKSYSVFHEANDLINNRLMRAYWGTKLVYVKGGTNYEWPQNNSMPNEEWHRLEIAYNLSTGKQKGWNNGDYMGEIDFEITSLTKIGCEGVGSSFPTAIDLVYIRKWTDPEPQHGSWGTEEEYPPTWLSGWIYRKSHEINLASGAGQNYQIKIKVHYGDGTDSGENVYLNGKCKTDFGDIRFTKRDGETLLSYWLEEKIDSDYAIFWVKLTDDLSYSSTKIYLYYGKADASSQSDGESTFIFFDDFSGDLSNWTVVSDSWNIVDGELKPNGDVTYSKIIVKDVSIENGRLRWRGRNPTAEYPEFGGMLRYQDYKHYYSGMVEKKIHRLSIYRFYNVDSYLTVATKTYYLDNDYHTFDFRVNGSTLSFCVDDDPNYEFSGTDTNYTGAQGVGLTRQVAGTSYECYFDWVFLAKYTYPEPAHGSWGTEEIHLECQEGISKGESLIKILRKVSKDSIQFTDLNPKKSPRSFFEALSLSDLSSWHWLFFGSEFLTLLESKTFLFGKRFLKVFHLTGKEISKRPLAEVFSISSTIREIYKLKELSENLLLQILLTKTLRKGFSESILFKGVFEKLQRMWEQISLSYSFSRYKIPIFFSTGFETGDFSRWSYVRKAADGSDPILDTQYTHHGQYSVKLVKVSGGNACLHKKIDLNPIWVKCFYRYTGGTSAKSLGPCIAVEHKEGYDFEHPYYLGVGGIPYDESLNVSWIENGGIYQSKLMEGEFKKDVWHSIVLGAFRDETNGWYKVYVDDKLVFEKKNINTAFRLTYPWVIGCGAKGSLAWTYTPQWFDCFAVSNQFISSGAADPPPPELSIFQSLLFYPKIAFNPQHLILISLKLLSKILPFYFKKVLKEEEKVLIFEVNA